MSSENITFAGNFVPYNDTLWDNPTLCTLSTCPKSYAVLQYVPSLAGNAFFLAWFALIAGAQLLFGIKYKTWTFLVAMLGGCFLEVAGYAARISLWYNVFDFNRWLTYLICLTIAPCFFNAAIYLTFSRLILLHNGKHGAYTWLKPKTYSYIFIAWDILSLVLQATGGALADTSTDDESGQKKAQQGINIMIGGLASQIASLTIFILVCADFVRRMSKDWNSALERLYDGLGKVGGSERWWKALILSQFVAVLTIFIRSIFRVAELTGGFQGHLANDQVTFMVLEGSMIAVAAASMTIVHPGFLFHGHWKYPRMVDIMSSGASAYVETGSQNAQRDKGDA